MLRIAILKNSIQEYEWGSKTAIPELLGTSVPAVKPQAELWLGAHPKTPSFVFYEGRWLSLLELIERAPEDMLGERAAIKFRKRLPFLFKILAAAIPLPIQAHPDLIQAREGFARENSLGIPLTDCRRNYVDDNHKPEMICALSDFWALCGFRSPGDLIECLQDTCPLTLKNEISGLLHRPVSVGLKRFIEDLVNMDLGRKREIIAEAVFSATKLREVDPAMQWLITLNTLYPDDIWALSPLFLNTTRLEPGQALFIHAREPHAYLGGVGIELMANSDNTLRGGLTTRHIDLDELLKILNFEGKKVTALNLHSFSPSEEVYLTEAEEFVLSRIRVRGSVTYVHNDFSGIELIICTEGEARMIEAGQADEIQVNKGVSLVIPAAVKGYRVEGQATLYKATVPF